MKKIPLLFLLAVAAHANAQQPSQKDMDKAMAEYNKMMKDPQLKKTMDSMIR